jgi:fumarate reductase subunit C
MGLAAAAVSSCLEGRSDSWNSMLSILQGPTLFEYNVVDMILPLHSAKTAAESAAVASNFLVSAASGASVIAAAGTNVAGALQVL